jgi:glutamyl-Q tRNA(Asp) synthetase
VSHSCMKTAPVVGRFAPSPTGFLHAGSLVAAMASYLDARGRNGSWLVRIEDIDAPRSVPGSEADILATLAAFGFVWSGPVLRQSERTAAYASAFDLLRTASMVYPCGCTRREIEAIASAPTQDAVVAAVYPGTCRHGLVPGRIARAWRVRTNDDEIVIDDRAAGRYAQHLARDVGDFVVKRADGIWAYQLAAVVDDAAQGVTDIVRGADLLDSTPRQRWLQTLLGLPHPRTLHVPLVLDVHGDKLAKQNAAAPLDRDDPLPALHAAARHLGLSIETASSKDAFWRVALEAWPQRWPADA